MYARRRLTHDVLATRPSGSVEQCLREYVEANDPPLRKLQVLIDDVKSARRPTLAALLVVMRALGRLVGERP
jgi:NAD-specific glutamate dehydrogenase